MKVIHLLRASRPGVEPQAAAAESRSPDGPGPEYSLGDFAQLPSVQSKIQAVAEQVANHTLVAYCPNADWRFHEWLEDLVAEAIESTLRDLNVPEYSEWVA